MGTGIADRTGAVVIAILVAAAASAAVAEEAQTTTWRGCDHRGTVRAFPAGGHGYVSGFISADRLLVRVRQGFIDRFGRSRIHLVWAHPTAFGNRLFIRTHACLYCFGKGQWKPPK